MQKYQCIACGYIYDPAENDDIPFEQLPDAGLARNVESAKICLNR